MAPSRYVLYAHEIYRPLLTGGSVWPPVYLRARVKIAFEQRNHIHMHGLSYSGIGSQILGNF